MPVTIDLPPDLQREAERAAAARGVAVSDYLLGALRETFLLQKIHAAIPEATWRRYGELMDKFRRDPLTSEEDAELTRLGDEVEQRNAERLEYVLELARLRGVTLKQMMTQLGIKPRRVGKGP